MGLAARRMSEKPLRMEFGLKRTGSSRYAPNMQALLYFTSPFSAESLPPGANGKGTPVFSS